MPELLCPAGGRDQLEAAISGGCDAVYLGGSRFSARAKAENFDDTEIIKAVEKCRLFGVRVYVALNTLLRTKQLAQALDFVDLLESQAPPDAYIVQDMGLLYELHRRYPGIPLHASTQMAVHSSGAVDMLRRLGVKRVICAREMCREDIACLCRVIETEVFVHGALCVSQSGGCLFSSFVGGNSGNCGKCAQPCRLEYRGSERYPLSLKDLCLAGHVRELIDMGVASFKIEGRMKDPAYVYTTARVYRKLIDERRNATSSELELLSAVFSRSGFTDGYFTSTPSRSMFGVRTEHDKRMSRETDIEIIPKKLDVSLDCTVSLGKPAVLTMGCAGHSFTAVGAVAERAQTAGITVKRVETSLSKLGDTCFSAKNINVELDEGVSVSVSELNALRRDAAEGLRKKIVSGATPKHFAADGAPCLTGNVPQECYDVLRFEYSVPDFDRLPGNARYVDVPLWRLRRVPTHILPQVRVLMPRVVFDSELDDIRSLLKNAREIGVRSAVIRNPAQLVLVREFDVFADFTFNIMNECALDACVELMEGGLKAVAVSPEFPLAAVDPLRKPIQVEYPVYGRLPLMHTQTCIIRRINGRCEARGRSCIREPDCRAVLVDRMGEKFPVVRETGHRNVIYNSRPLWNEPEKHPHCGHIWCFTDESTEEIISVLAGGKPRKYTRGY